MTVLSVAYPLFPVGPDSSGGAEQILYLIEREIVKAGHRSIVIAAKGSTVSGELVETPSTSAEMTEDVRHYAQVRHADAISTTLANARIDVIHFHGLDFSSYLPQTVARKIATLHLPLAWYPQAIFAFENVRLVCVSNSQAQGTGLTVIGNGVDLARFRRTGEKDDYLLWLGRICPEKGVHLALQIARQLDMSLIVAGPVHAFGSHQEYFASKVQPLLDDRRRYIGAVNGEEKDRLLASARCLLVPSLVAETSSLVAMEAISAGTPVVAFSNGALPEVVEHGVTGFIVDSESAMATAIRQIETIDPETCRGHAAARFDARSMSCTYLALYRAMLDAR